MEIKISIALLFILNCLHAQETAHEDIFGTCRKEFSKKVCLSDEDKDGVLFYIDRCPKESGSIENNGCPWPDTDKDGVIDKDDICPSVEGPFENNGCPWPDTDGDGILDKDDACPTIFGYGSDVPGKNGCMKQDCKKLYEEGQIRLKRFVDEPKFVNYDKLREKIIDDISLKLFTADNVVIFNRTQTFICGTGREYYCPVYYDYQTPIFSTRAFWNEEVLTKIYDRFTKNIIFAIKNEGEGSGTEFEEKPILNKKNKPVKIVDEYGIERNAILYQKLKNTQAKVSKYNSLFIKITKNDFENKVEVTTSYTNINDKYNEVYITTYQYIDNEWIVIETKKEI